MKTFFEMGATATLFSIILYCKYLGHELYPSLTAYNSTGGGLYNPGYRRQPNAGLPRSPKF